MTLTGHCARRETPILWAQLRISGAAAEPVSMQETLNWRAFSMGGPYRSNDLQGWQEGEKYCNATTAGCS